MYSVQLQERAVPRSVALAPLLHQDSNGCTVFAHGCVIPYLALQLVELAPA